MIPGFIGETLQWKSLENKLLVVCHIHHIFHDQTFALYQHHPNHFFLPPPNTTLLTTNKAIATFLYTTISYVYERLQHYLKPYNLIIGSPLSSTC